MSQAVAPALFRPVLDAVLQPPADSSETSAAINVQAVDVDSEIDVDSGVHPNVDDESADGIDSAPPDQLGQLDMLDPTPMDAVDEAGEPCASQRPVVQRNFRDWLRSGRAVLTRHARWMGGCGIGLILGSGLALCLRWPPPEAENRLSLEPEQAQPKLLLAATLRRHEPIEPLLPFADLDPDVVELGQRLFHEPGLSGNGRTACATCHPLDNGGALATALPAIAPLEACRYNTPSVCNAALNYAQLWDGSVGTLEELVDIPITSPQHLDSSWERVIHFLEREPSYRDAFSKVLGGQPTPERVRTALATFVRSLIPLDSPFDQWLRGDERALNSDEYGGYFLFKKFQCYTCHQGRGVGGSMFQRLGVAKPYFNQQSTDGDLGRFQTTHDPRDRHVFRVPQLRNVALTAPYLHDGSLETLEQVVAVMLEYQCGQAYTQEDVRRLTAFLKTLTGRLPAHVENRLHPEPASSPAAAQALGRRCGNKKSLKQLTRQ